MNPSIESTLDEFQLDFFWWRKNLPFMKSVCIFRMKVMAMSFGFMVTSITLTSLISIIEPDMFESI